MGGTLCHPRIGSQKAEKFCFGALCLKMHEPFLNEKSATFLKLILLRFLENANNATPPRPAFDGATPQQNFLLHFFRFRAPPKN
jgi:hypothetical protein